MSRNWELSEKLTTEKKTLELLNVEVAMAELENEYYATEEYQGMLARKYLDKKTLLIVTHREPIQAICSRHYEFENNIMKEI